MSPDANLLSENQGAEARTQLLREFGKGLHDLCQPLTTLQCRLYLGAMEQQPEALKEAFAECLLECEQVIHSVNQLQKRLGNLRSGSVEEA